MAFAVSRKTLIGVLSGILASLVFAWTLVLVEQKRTAGELNDVLSAYLSERILNDAHDWGPGRGILVVLQREAQPPGMWRTRLLYPFEKPHRFTESSFLTRGSFVVSNAIPSNLVVTLQLPDAVRAVTVTRRELKQSEGSNLFQARFPDNLGYIAVSELGLNPGKTEAIFYIDHFCGLCGGGRYVLMQKVGGVWKVAAEHYTWVS